ncbi:hypothetical protein POM88_029380 [Heracleum sosnowskyi]|uniref:HD-Zip IV C-terminal domain-containing protein n=1 Tax=Heracleum sosnowskyi TaxID=360622 RepID=A0AAD8MHP0_9APIA|nr:hypothetical protein POM88_029380 [Heracleum sosnowskyi]
MQNTTRIQSTTCTVLCSGLAWAYVLEFVQQLMHYWEVFQVGNMGEDARLMIRKGVHGPGEPSSIILSATLSVWIPVQQQQLFDLLQNEELRSRWDLSSHGGQMQQMVHIAKGQDSGNRISLSFANQKS